MSERVLLIDGNYLIFRAYFGFPIGNFQHNGMPTNAIYGFLSILHTLLEESKAKKVGIAFDVSSKTFRKEIYPEYKAGRRKMDDELYEQIPYVHEMVSILGLPHKSIENYEGDDIIASVTKSEKEKGNHVFIYTGDKDAYQLIDNNVTVLKPKRGATEMDFLTPKRLSSLFSLTPGQYRDYAALVGETADNLIGAKGIGPKTATELLAKYNNLEGIYNNLDELRPKIKETLIADKSKVYLNKKLNKLVDDLEIDIDLLLKPINKADFDEFFDSVGFKTLPNTIIYGDIFTFSEKKNSKNQQRTLPKASKKTDFYTIFNSNSMCAIIKKNEAPYIEQEVSKIKQLIENDEKKVVYNLKSLLHFINDINIKPKNIFDLSIASHLVNSELKIKSAAELLKNNNNISLFETKDDEELLFDTAIELKNTYNDIYENLVDINGIDLLDNIEIPLATILFKMEHNGISINVQKLKELSIEIENSVHTIEREAKSIAKSDVNLNSPKQLQNILFEKLKFPKTKKIKTGYTTDSNALTNLFIKTKHPFLEKLLVYRDFIKKSQTIKTLLSSVGNDKKIHTTFLQNQTSTGRLASENPNLQNIPIKSDVSLEIRDTFIPENDKNIFISADYSQIEMRIIAHMSNDNTLIDAFKSGQDLHVMTASKVYNIIPEKVTSTQRSATKSLVYGLSYGLGTFGIANSLKISNADAKKLKDDFFNSFPKLHDFFNGLVDSAKKKGYTETIVGRRRNIPEILSSNQMVKASGERMAQNAPIQGSAADIIKKAMVDIDKVLAKSAKMLLQIHDELVIECSESKKDETIKVVKEKMENAFKLKVPLVANIGFGKSLKKAQH